MSKLEGKEPHKHTHTPNQNIKTASALDKVPESEIKGGTGVGGGSCSWLATKQG